MKQIYIPYYKTEVEESTFLVRKRILEKITERFGHIILRSISVEEKLYPSNTYVNDYFKFE